MENVLLFFSLKYQGNWNEIYRALDHKEKVDLKLLKKVRQEIEKPFLTIIGDEYPAALKNITRPPFVIYYQGNKELLQNYHQTIGMVGDELYNDDGIKNGERFLVDFINENRVLLFGDNQGLDRHLWKKVIQENGKFIIITNRGLQNFLFEEAIFVEKLSNYPDFLIISESYETATTFVSNGENYLNLKVGLSKAFVFVQNTTNGTSLELGKCAWQENKEVFVIPEPLNSKFKGNNMLIKDGGKLVETAQEVLNQI
ncbi:DNA processing protein [Entomoplasma freundtii]|uniref:DNA processing/uptake protein n=1 Tax=Entomoplasma freundtii TaxID=74700 RepID=A0A2K8NRE3_9MOLU|nr:DNA-processing protein DprA [Entomoplasma freundtii]ATZ16415.1 DNA processing/uptake protein [Entomoplasma freundtii]TDY56546.1 DNA processing protein [Entomoplasma freundtii]